MRIRKNVIEIGKKAVLWLLISVMILGVLAACEPSVPLDDFTSDEPTSDEPTSAEPAPTEPTDTKPEDTEPQETEPQETEPQETEPADTEPVEPEKHILSAVAANEATCTEDGNIAYWTCSHCDKLFGDADGKTVIAKDSITIGAKGHTEVIDEAVAPTYDHTGLTEGKHCSVCKTVLQAQEEVPVLKPTYHAIVYKNLMGAETPETTTYAEHMGMYDLPENITVNGYKFKGWYTKSEGGEKIEYIPKGTTEDVVLCAHWEKIPYHIHYLYASGHDNPTTYTIEDTIYLHDPQWSGLAFVNWTDEDGNVVTKLPKGTTGDMVLTANWTTYRNRVVSKENTKLLSTYDEKSGRYHFICELGMISNVVVDNIVEPYDKFTTTDYTLTTSQTVTVEQTVSQSIARMIGKAVTESDEWSEIIEDSTSQTSGWNVGGSLGVDIPIKLVWLKIKAEGGYESSTTDFDSTTKTTSKITSNTTEKSLEISSMMSYRQQMSTTQETSIIITGDMPNGKYSYVHTVDVRVYAIVTYDIEEDCFYLDTYSIMDDMSITLLYQASEYGVGSYTEPMAYNVPCDRVNDYLDSLYFVRYDSNLDDSDMRLSVLESGKEMALPANDFTREGFTFTGWSATPDGDVVYADEATVKDLAAGRDFITLYAVWEPLPYTLTWNDGTGYSIQVERKSSYKKDAAIGVLSKDDTIYYGDVLEIAYIAAKDYVIETHGATSVVVAGNVDSSIIYATAGRDKYAVAYDANGGTGAMDRSAFNTNETYTLPANQFVRNGFAFAGWKMDGYTELLGDQATVNNLAACGETVTLVAQWTPNKYQIVYDGNGATSGSVASQNEVSFDSSVTLRSNSYTRSGYVFIGWSTDPSATEPTYKAGQSVRNLTSGNSITLYAVWLDVYYEKSVSGLHATVTDDYTSGLDLYYYVQDELDLAKIESYGLKGYITFTFTIKELQQGTQDVVLWASDTSNTWNVLASEQDIEIKWGAVSSASYTMTAEIIYAQTIGTCIVVECFADGAGGDDWELRDTKMVVEFRDPQGNINL